MSESKKSAEWIPAIEAAKIVGVHYNSIRLWMKTGRVKFKIGKYKHMTMALVLTSSLETAFDVKCRLCGKAFQVQKRPEKTKFCCDKHRWEWNNRRRYGTLNAYKPH